MSIDDKALQFADLEVKRDRTLADLDTVRRASREAFESLKTHLPGEGDKLHEFIRDLGAEGLSNTEADRLRARWQEALASSSAEFHELVEEILRLRLEEKILQRMIETLDHQLGLLRRDLEQ